MEALKVSGRRARRSNVGFKITAPCGGWVAGGEMELESDHAGVVVNDLRVRMYTCSHVCT